MRKTEDKIEKEERLLRREYKNLIFNLIFAFLTVFLVILFYKNILLTSILLGLVTIIGFIKWKSWLAFSIFIFGAFWGPVCEIAAVKFGVWSYALPNIWNIPFWPFIVWGNAAVFLYETALELKRLGIKK